MWLLVLAPSNQKAGGAKLSCTVSYIYSALDDMGAIAFVVVNHGIERSPYYHEDWNANKYCDRDLPMVILLQKNANF